MLSDPIADMLTRIRNAQLAHKSTVEIPFSKLKKSIADILSQEGYIGTVEVKNGRPSFLVVVLKYADKRPAITSLKRESKPGHRKYKKTMELPRVLNDYGLAIISTSKGLMTNKQAREQGLGGEVICSVY
jgi:small subunit ribosomal protein S8